MALLRVRELHKSFGDQPVLRGVSLDVEAGELVCLLGPSGCGKTTFLRVVAGLEEPDSGTLHFGAENLAQVPVHRRRFGLMFQDFALFPHLNVYDNVAYGLRMVGWKEAAVRGRVAEMLALVNLAGYEGRTVFELSGGERQRVALARSLAPSPRLLMLDEPLGSLDRTLRERLMVELRSILKEVGVTALYVTHDQQEAFAVADRIVVMHRGRFEQIGTPEAVYARPATPFVARFLGLNNLIPALVEPSHLHQAVTPIGTFRLPEPAHPGEGLLLIRPEVDRGRLGQEGDAGTIQGTLTAISFRGSDYHIDLVVRGEDGRDYRLAFILPTRLRRRREEWLPQVGAGLRLGIDTTQLVFLEGPILSGTAG